MARKTRKNIKRIDTRPRSRPDVQAGVTGAKLGLSGDLLGGTLPTGEKVGTAAPSGQIGGKKVGLIPKLGGAGIEQNTEQPNAAAQSLMGHAMGSPATSLPASGNVGAQPVQATPQIGTMTGLDRQAAANPETLPGQAYKRKDSEAQSVHRQSMRVEADAARTALIQGTQSEEAGLAKQTGMPVIAPSIQAGRDAAKVGTAAKNALMAGAAKTVGGIVGAAPATPENPEGNPPQDRAVEPQADIYSKESILGHRPAESMDKSMEFVMLSDQYYSLKRLYESSDDPEASEQTYAAMEEIRKKLPKGYLEELRSDENTG